MRESVNELRCRENERLKIVFAEFDTEGAMMDYVEIWEGRDGKYRREARG